MIGRRKIARPGLSYVDANQGRLITEHPDLLAMKGRIRERWPSLDIYFDHQEKVFVVTQFHDGVEKFVMSRPYCDERLLYEISKTDPDHRNYVDPLKAVDDHNASVERDRDRKLADDMGEFGERFIHALKKDGYYDHEHISHRGKPGLRKKAVNAGVRTQDRS